MNEKSQFLIAAENQAASPRQVSGRAQFVAENGSEGSGRIEHVREIRLGGCPVVTSDSGRTTEELLSMTRSCLDEGNAVAAIGCVNEVLSRGRPPEGTHLLRARVFATMERCELCRSAAIDELVAFPNNLEAKNFLLRLADVELKLSADKGIAIDHCFVSLVEKIATRTRIPIQKLWMIYALSRDVCWRKVPGDFVACGGDNSTGAVLQSWIISHYSTSRRSVLDITGSDLAPARGVSEWTTELNNSIVSRIVSRQGTLSDTVTRAESAQCDGFALIHFSSLNLESASRDLGDGYAALRPGGILAFSYSSDSHQEIQVIQSFRTRFSRRVPFEKLEGFSYFQKI